MPMETAEVAARAKTENFPIASVLFPRELRPHLRAIYGFARLVDILGDEVEGDRLAALDELERGLDACSGEGAPSWPVMRRLEPTIVAFSLLREPFLGLIEANRMDQRVSEYDSWDDLKGYCVHSADPVGRLVLGLLRRAGDPELVAASDDVCTGLQLVNFLQDVPRDLALGRVYLPAEDRRRFGVLELDRPNEPLRSLLQFEAALPRPKRQAIAAIYAFAREVDDIADGELDPGEKRARLEELHAALDAPPPGSAMWVALADARERYPIPSRSLHDLVAGGLQDLDRPRYGDFDELLGYCRKVAGAVGVACVAVYGADQPQRAETLGVALQ